jgi:hypothetical protein
MRASVLDRGHEEEQVMRMKASVLRIAVGVAATLMVTGLAFAQTVDYNYDRTTDFTKFKAYKWVSIEGAQHPDQITDGNIRTIVDKQLAAKGLTKKDADPVDLYVGYGTTVDQEKMITGYGGGGWRFGGMGMAETSTIKNGTILLDIYSPSGKLLVWRGTVTETLDPSANPDKNYQHLQKALAKLLKNFPPPVSK